MNRILDSLEVPVPPYRMRRPVAAFTSAPSASDPGTPAPVVAAIPEPKPVPAEVKPSPNEVAAGIMAAREAALKDAPPAPVVVEAPKPAASEVIEKPTSPEETMEGQLREKVDSMAQQLKDNGDVLRPDDAEVVKAKTIVDELSPKGDKPFLKGLTSAQLAEYQEKLNAPKAPEPVPAASDSAAEKPALSPKALASLEAERDSLLNAAVKPRGYQELLKQYNEAIAKKAEPAAKKDVVTLPGGSADAEVLERDADGKVVRTKRIPKPEPAERFKVSPTGRISGPALTQEELEREAKAAGRPVPPPVELPADTQPIRLTPEERAALQKADEDRRKREAAAAPTSPPPIPSAAAERPPEDKVIYVKPGEKIPGSGDKVPPLPQIPEGLRKAIERADQEKLGAEMARETTEKAAREAEAKIPRADRVNMTGYLREGLRFVGERTGNPKTWMEAFARRMDTWENRSYAVWSGMFQQRSEGKLETAREKVREYREKLEDVGILSKLWYGNRLRAWEAHAGTLEAKVEKWNARREQFTERHTAMQQEVISRYNRELAPYRDVVKDFSGRLDMQLKVRETLAGKREEALQRLAEAEAAGKKGGRWFMGPRARRCVQQIKDQLKDMDRRIAAVDKTADGFRKKLGDANTGITKWETKKNVVARTMELPELKGLKRPKRSEAVPVRGFASSEQYAEPASSEAAPAAPTAPEQDPSLKEWKPDDFIAQWNSFGLQRIEDPKAFAEYLELARRGQNIRGPLTGKQMTDLLTPYVEKASPVKVDKKQLQRDIKFFFTNAKPKN